MDPDVLVLQGIDYDLYHQALNALRNRIADRGVEYPYMFALRPNTGLPTGLDLDGNARLREARDRQGYGAFSGQSGMAILSKYPFDESISRDFSGLLWSDLPGALLPVYEDGRAFPSEEAVSAQRLSSVGHWVVPVLLPVSGEMLTLLTFHAGPPAFDGLEDRNGRRNYDEVRFWSLFLDGQFGPPPQQNFILLGGANQDPLKGESRNNAIRRLLDDPRLQDPLPALNTAYWPSPGPGALRVDYILSSRDLRVMASGVFGSGTDEEEAKLSKLASSHHLIWADLLVE